MIKRIISRACALLAAAFTSGVNFAHAQACVCPDQTFEFALAEADFAFLGKARGSGDVCDGTIHRPGDAPFATMFDVIEVLGGEVDERFLARHEKAAAYCGKVFEPGTEYLVFGTVNEKGAAFTNACSARSVTSKLVKGK